MKLPTAHQYTHFFGVPFVINVNVSQGQILIVRMVIVPGKFKIGDEAIECLNVNSVVFLAETRAFIEKLFVLVKDTITALLNVLCLIFTQS